MQQQEKLTQSAQEKREQLFTDRYPHLLKWALQLTNQQRARAEDLVHDAFIQFSLGTIRVEQIVNIDGYLRQMLRYIHLSQRTRNAEKVLEQTLSISDYESFHQSRHLFDNQDRLQIEEELWRICAYACARKETSKAGAVLILRFFHEYYPSEIAQVMRNSRHCIDQWQRVARLELKAYLTEPDRVRFVGVKRFGAPDLHSTMNDDGDLMKRLRQTIFQSRRGDCLEGEELSAMYDEHSSQSLTTPLLGHLVSCVRCLDVVNRRLQLPLLNERYRYEADSKHVPPGDGNGGGPTGPGFTDQQKKTLEQRRRDVFEHTPKELRIAVNGLAIGVLKVNSDLTEMELSLDGQRRIKFIEVFGDNDVRLLLMPVAGFQFGSTSHTRRIALSDGRALEVQLSAEQTFKVVYAQSPDTTEPAPCLRLVQPNEPAAGSVGDKNSVRQRFGWLSVLVKLFSGLARGLASVVTGRVEDFAKPEDREKAPSLSGFVTNHPWFLRTGWLTVCFSALLIALFLGIRISTPVLTAERLLQKAATAEQMNHSVGGMVTHRVLRLEERLAVNGPVVADRKIEIWQDSQGRSARFVYDNVNKLVAASWDWNDGTRTIYHHGSAPVKEKAESKDVVRWSVENIWQFEPSAEFFLTIISNDLPLQLENTSNGYILRSAAQKPFGSSRVVGATILLSAVDQRAIEQTLTLEIAGQVRAYKFVETNFEQLNIASLPPHAFEVSPTVEVSASENTLAPIKRINPRVASGTSPGPAASVELEVELSHLLDGLKGDRHEQLTLSRGANGVLVIEGVVETEERRLEILNALASFRNNPAVKISVLTLQQFTSRGEAKTINVQAQSTSNIVAVDAELRRYFSNERGSLQPASTSKDVDELIRIYCSRVVNRSYRILFQAIELDQLTTRFATADMQSITPDARAKWFQMLRLHATALQRETVSLRGQLVPVFQSQSTTPKPTVISNDLELRQAVQELHVLVKSSNTAVGEAFTNSTHSSSSAFKASQFWHSLTQIESLAIAIQTYAR